MAYQAKLGTTKQISHRELGGDKREGQVCTAAFGDTNQVLVIAKIASKMENPYWSAVNMPGKEDWAGSGSS